MSRQVTDFDAIIRNAAERLSKLPNSMADASEMAKAIKRHCRSPYHCQQVVQCLLDSSQWAPTPATIREVAEIVPSKEPPRYRPTNDDCSRCGGTGFMPVPPRASRGAFRGLKYPGVKICDCRLTSSEHVVVVAEAGDDPDDCRKCGGTGVVHVPEDRVCVPCTCPAAKGSRAIEHLRACNAALRSGRIAREAAETHPTCGAINRRKKPVASETAAGEEKGEVVA